MFKCINVEVILLHNLGPADYRGGTFPAQFEREAGAKFCQGIPTVVNTDSTPKDETFLVNIMIIPSSPLRHGTPNVTRVFITGMR